MEVAINDERQGGPDAELRLSVPSDPHVSAYVRQAMIAFAESHGIVDDDVVDFVAAVGEALANAIEHAHTGEPIEIAAWLLGNDRLFASVTDHGVGFAPSEPAAALPDAYAERGRGLPIMRRCTDVFTVRSAPGQGTRVTLGCRIGRAAGLHHLAGLSG
jgi:anti-sigma regulatory factor (Ser/Thr protein kinase)